MKKNSFNKGERLCSRKILDQVFADGKSFGVSPFRLVWMDTALPNSAPVQITFSVPKRYYKHAADRNLVKRRMREAYRKNKHTMYEFVTALNKQYALVLIYNGRAILDYQEIEEKLNVVLKKFTDRCNETPA